ncbi:MAG: ABC transporter ATP-binding protein [Lachnospiraceae bacterium]|nr:ABC transporter ATP-binding protein [Lachnospiraceae bacterium]
MSKHDRKLNVKTIKKVIRYIGKYRFLLLCSVLLAAISVVLTLYIPILTGQVIDCIIGPGNVDFDKIAGILVTMLIVIITTAVLQWIMNICNNKIAYKVVQNMRNEAFVKLQKLPLGFVDGKPHGDIVSRIITDVEQFSDGLLMGFTQLFTGIVTIVVTLVFMLMINPVITAVVVILTPLSFFVAGFIAKRTYNMSLAMSDTRGEQTAYIDEMIGNEKIVKLFGRKEKIIDDFDEINDRLKKVSVKAIFFSSLTNPCTRFVNSLVYAGVGILGAFFVINGYISVGQLSSFLSYANQYTKPFNEISGVITEFQAALACAERVFEFIEEEQQIPDSADALVLDDVNGSIDMLDVSFSYTKEQKLIRNLNLSVSPGQRVAIVGPTGCGKTTIINLLMRFYDVNAGKICVDNTDIRDITRESLRKNYGMVLQETWLKSGTIKENIAMGRPDATTEEIINAAKASYAHGFISRLPQGYDTVIGEDGGGLSQGQKQLLCIARVMLCLPPMLILDEATSSIDTRTEMRIQDAFAKMMKGRTSFIVAHRLSTIREADIILVMKDGNIIEQGKHDELLSQGGFYANLYQSQFSM